MKNVKRFSQRLVTFKTSLDGGLFVDGKFRGRMILEGLRSKVELMAPGESWDLGKTELDYWVIIHNHSKRHHATWTVPPGRSLASPKYTATIPLPDDLRERFEKAMERKSMVSSLWKNSAMQDYLNFILKAPGPPVIDGRQRRIYVDASCMLGAYPVRH